VTPLSEWRTWRQLLATLISDSDERSRISQASGIDEVTLRRYAENKTKRIRSHMLRPIVAAVPRKYRAPLIELLREEFPDFSYSEFLSIEGDELQKESERAPFEVYERVLHAHATIPLALRFWTICDLVLGAALEQLDPGPQTIGIKVILVQCMRSNHDDGVIHCLREAFVLGTGPWKMDQTMPLFLGAESLAGYAVTTCRPAICQNLRENPAFLPVRPEAYEESSVAYPLLQGDKVGGCLVVVTTMVNFFTPARLQLVSAYTDLAVLALQDDQFYEKQEIQLLTMPPTDIQQAHFASFRKRVHEMLSVPDSQVTNIVEAEELVWRQIAEELMDIHS
jgi:hypothetical protein